MIIPSIAGSTLLLVTLTCCDEMLWINAGGNHQSQATSAAGRIPEHGPTILGNAD
jgi:hypothetical protein